MLWRGQMEYSVGAASAYLKYLDPRPPHHIYTFQHANLIIRLPQAWPAPWGSSCGLSFLVRNDCQDPVRLCETR